VTLAIHDAQIAEHGGMPGVRDITLLRSALARSQSRHCYGQADIADLAASYGYGIARNHPFNDGNKRTAFVVTELFLTLNGYRLLAEDIASVLTMLAVASGEVSEDQFADWIRNHIENI
jgi:death-on-curing protein